MYTMRRRITPCSCFEALLLLAIIASNLYRDADAFIATCNPKKQLSTIYTIHQPSITLSFVTVAPSLRDDFLLPKYPHSGTALFAIKATIRMVGRKGETWIEDGCAVYVQRLKSQQIFVETELYKSDETLIKAIANADVAKNAVVVILDPQGSVYESESFAQDFYKWAQAGGSRITFVIGGADGLPEELRPNKQHISSNSNNFEYLSLSKLTLTHQFARLLLIEQIYRASEIRKGTGYHK